jgi:diguanylate cyclase (GGDEF)-like protein|tara:strand:+ start:10340 stop:11233 length:894 start_codon:yes stop_codon:yes gene_type:complete
MHRFNCLLFATNFKDGKLVFANEKATEYFQYSANSNYSLTDMFSRASLVFYESYVKPILLESGECTEVQLSLLQKTEEEIIKMPVVANVGFNGTLVYWSVFTALERDKLYQQILATKQTLEKQSEELIQLARLDPLTGLLNRRAIRNDFDKLSKQLRRVPVPVVVAIIDIDYFKKINDSYGHHHGDEIISRLSLVLKNTFRETDIISRWGGEEFLVVLYNCDLQGSKDIFRKLHKSVSEIEIAPGHYLSVSIGVSKLPEGNQFVVEVFEDVGRQADEALYSAKANGRARTVYWTDEN